MATPVLMPDSAHSECDDCSKRGTCEAYGGFESCVIKDDLCADCTDRDEENCRICMGL